MTQRNARIIVVVAFILPTVVMAQGGGAATPGTPLALPTKVGIVSIQSAIVQTNDGQNDLQVLEKKFDPTKNELKSLSDDIESLKKQLETQGSKLNDEARANLTRQIDSKQKTLSRTQEDAQNDFTEQQNEIVQRVLQKLLPVIDKYAQDNSLSFVLDKSKSWPEWPVLWASPSVDITKAVVDIYNAHSAGLPASRAPRSSGPSQPIRTEKAPQPTSPKPQGSEPPN
jgi:outer membrane protein